MRPQPHPKSSTSFGSAGNSAAISRAARLPTSANASRLLVPAAAGDAAG